MAFFNFGSRSDLSSPFTEEQARLLTWTKVLEEEALKRRKITISELKEVSARCAREVGEQADFKKLLLTRAEGVLELLRSKRRAARQMGGDDPGAEWAEDHALHDESLFGARRR